MRSFLDETLRQSVLILELMVAGALATILGYQRHRQGRPAGIRTHIMVSLASCAFTIAGVDGFHDIVTPRDPARIAAQVVAGIGFLGAGVIFKTNTSVRGLTTAASLWVAAALGVLVGAQLVLVAMGLSVMAYITLSRLQEFGGRSTLEGQEPSTSGPTRNRDVDS